MLPFLRLLSCAFLASLFISACSIPQPNDPEMPTFRSVGRVDADGIFAVDPSAERVALQRKGLQLVLIADGMEKQLSEKKPLAMSWSRSGERLAAAFAENDQSRLVIFSADGREQSSVMIGGRITQLSWSAQEQLFALALELTVYSFGANQKATLVSWTPEGSLERTPLFDTTLKTHTLTELGDDLYRLSQFNLAPLGDEIVYTRLADPPVIEKSLKLVHLHLVAGTGRWIYDLPLESGASLWTSDSETLLISDGIKTYLWDPWQQKERQLWALPGHYIATSAVGKMIYIDGFLYQGNTEIARLPSGPAVFSHDGKHLLFASKNELFIYDMPMLKPGTLMSQQTRDRLLLLRELRSKALLSQDEYRRTRDELLL